MSHAWYWMQKQIIQANYLWACFIKELRWNWENISEINSE